MRSRRTRASTLGAPSRRRRGMGSLARRARQPESARGGGWAGGADGANKLGRFISAAKVAHYIDFEEPPRPEFFVGRPGRHWPDCAPFASRGPNNADAFWGEMEANLAWKARGEERYNKELAIPCLGGAEQWTIAKDRQKETPSSHSFEQDGLRFTWMLDVPVWLYRRHFLRKPTWCCNTGGTCRFPSPTSK
jgi:hypothetical protein